MSPVPSAILRFREGLGEGFCLSFKGCKGHQCICFRRLRRCGGVVGGDVGDDVVKSYDFYTKCSAIVEQRLPFYLRSAGRAAAQR